MYTFIWLYSFMQVFTVCMPQHSEATMVTTLNWGFLHGIPVESPDLFQSKLQEIPQIIDTSFWTSCFLFNFIHRYEVIHYCVQCIQYLVTSGPSAICLVISKLSQASLGSAHSVLISDNDAKGIRLSPAFPSRFQATATGWIQIHFRDSNLWWSAQQEGASKAPKMA